MSQRLFLYGTLLPSEAPKEIASIVKRFRRLEQLDRYEEFDPLDPKRSLFVRKKVRVQMTNGTSREGWIYVNNRPPGQAKLVRGGDCLRFKVA